MNDRSRVNADNAHPRTWAVRAAFVSVLLTACGGGGGSSDPPAAPPPQTPPVAAGTTLAGVAAIGAPLAGATITVVDGDASTADPAAVTAGADGSYSIDVSGLKLPLAVQATGTAGGNPVTLLALLSTLNGGAANTANVTPLTQAIAALMAPGGNPQALLSAGALAGNVDASRLANAVALLVNTLKTDPSLAAALGAGFNPMSTPFTADGTGLDAVLEQLEVQIAASGVSITNLAAPVGAGGAPQPVVLTPAQVATPTVVPTLPATSPDPLPTAAELAALGKKYQDCLALPVAQRVTTDTSGKVTAVLAPCNYAVPDWRSDGRNWAEAIGQFTFAKTLLSNATVGAGQVALTAAAPNLTDPKDFKHPYCNTSTCVVVRYPVTTASGVTVSSDWLLAKVAGAWNFVGNQLPYRVQVEPRMYRRLGVAGTGGASAPYVLKDRLESTLRLTFDLSVADTNNVRAVRFTGPGIPAAGLVQFRSQRCGTADRMAIQFQNGQTRVNNSTDFQFYTGAATTDFILDAANLDGTALAMPVPLQNATTLQNQNFAPAAVANQSTLIPAWSQYKVEVFHYDVLSDTPAEVMTVRVSAAAENAAAGATKAWPTLAADFIAAFLNPAGSGAGEVTGLTATMNWTAQAGGHVDGGYLFSENSLSATNAQGETAIYLRRGVLTFDPLALGDTSGPATEFNDLRSGTSLSTFTETLLNNPNPRCTSPGLMPLTASTNDYREAGLSVRGTDRKLRQATWHWDN